MSKLGLNQLNLHNKVYKIDKPTLISFKRKIFMVEYRRQKNDLTNKK